MDINMKYVIFNYIEIDKIDFEEVYENSIDTLRLNFDGSKTLVKWKGEEPSCIKNLTTKSKIYDNEEIVIILREPEWDYNNSWPGKTNN